MLPMSYLFLLASWRAPQVPPEWENAAYPCLKPLGSWVDDLIARLDAIRGWLVGGPPDAFWISGFFFPQGFMTGVLQTHARKTRIAIDTLDFRTEVLQYSGHGSKGDAAAEKLEKPPLPPANGVFAYGLFLEGARWDNAAGVLAEKIGRAHV